MGVVVDLKPVREARENEAYDALTAALAKAQASGTIRDMLAVARAWEAFVILTVPAGSGRDELLKL